MSISKITKSLESSKDIKFPPVHLWNPELCIGQQISINRDGEWFYNKSIIKNQKLVNLFASVLRKDDDKYFLVTPSEKVPVEVEIAPYMIIDFKHNENTIELTTNLNYSFELDQPDSMRLIDLEGTTLPLIKVRDNLEGFFSRSVYYKIIDFALEANHVNNGILLLESNSNFYPVGKIA